MEYIVLKNPTDTTVSIIYKGSSYVLEPGQSESLAADLVKHWLNIHGFLIVQDSEPQVEVAEVVEEKETKEVKPKTKSKK